MSRDALRIVERYFDAFNAADAAAIAAMASGEVVHDGPDGARSIGRDALRDALARRLAGNAERASDMVALASEDGSRAAAEYTLRGRDGSGNDWSRAAGIFLEIDGGRVSRITEYVRRT